MNFKSMAYIWKIEAITPIPNVRPTQKMEQLRPISCLKTFNKSAEKIFADIMIKDTKEKLDPAQYGNQKGLSTQHNLINMTHKTLS